MINELFEEVDEIQSKLQPSQHPYKMSKKVSRRAVQALADIDHHRNHSWAIEIFLRNRSNLNNTALQYRGNELSYQETFEEAFQFARALRAMGFKKGDEIPICVTNIPEFVSLFLAASYIGAVGNVFGEWFAEDYIIDILNRTGSEIVFVDDLWYGAIQSAVERSKIKRVVMFSMTDSLPIASDGKRRNPFEAIEGKRHSFQNKVAMYQRQSQIDIWMKKDFIKQGISYDSKIGAVCDLDVLSHIHPGQQSRAIPKGSSIPTELISHCRDFMKMMFPE